MTDSSVPAPGRRHARWWNPFARRRTRREWVADVVLTALGLLLWLPYGSGAVGLPPAAPEWFHPVDVALGLLSVVALWWARAHPVAVALVILPAGSVAVSAVVPAVAVVHRLAAGARPRWTLAVTALTIACALPYHLVVPLPGMPTAVWFVTVPLIYLLAMCSGLLARSRRQVLEGLRREAEQERSRHSEQLLSVRRAERQRVAREMHDVLAHRISLLSVHAGALEYRSAEGSGVDRALSAREVHEAAVVIRSAAHQAIAELAQVLSVLRADPVGDGSDDELGTAPPSPTAADLPALVADAVAAGERVALSWRPDDVTALPDPLQRTAFRVVQEGLTNARKHASGASVDVRLHVAPDEVLVRVVNPLRVGVTTGEIPGAGAGLAGLEERVAVDGGVLVRGVVDGEFRLEARLPLRTVRG